MTSLLVLGVGSSGTSATAGVLHKLGCPMGLPGHLAKRDNGSGLYEDVCFYGAFERGNLNYLECLIEQHRQQPVWGWKNTKTIKMIPELFDLLGEPRVVAVHRSLPASIRGRRDGRCPPGRYFSQQQAERWALEAMGEYMRALKATQGAGIPMIHVSFEELLEAPRRVVEDLAAFTFEQAPSADKIEAAMEHIEPRLVHKRENDGR